MTCTSLKHAWLTAASALARDGDSVAPHLIYLPEIPFSVDKFVEDVKGKLNCVLF